MAATLDATLATAAETTTLIALSLIALAFALGFLLPVNARFPAGSAG